MVTIESPGLGVGTGTTKSLFSAPLYSLSSAQECSAIITVATQGDVQNLDNTEGAVQAAYLGVSVVVTSCGGWIF